MFRMYSCFVFSLIAAAVVIPIIIFSISNARGNILKFKARPVNDTGYLSRYYQVRFRSADEINEYIINLINSYTFFCELVEIGHTSKKGLFRGYPVYLMKMSSGFPKPIILIIGGLLSSTESVKKALINKLVEGINANDWKSVTSILYVANQLLANCSRSGNLITMYDWHFVPLLNPDGYNYSQITPAANQWIKNIARWSMDYMGVNLDYNFRHHWSKRYNFNEDTYAGPKPFSEAESKSLKNYVLQVKDYIEMVIILKSPTIDTPTEPAITFPWSYTNEKPPNWVLLEYIGVQGAEAAKKATGTEYKVIQSGKQVKNQNGRIDDWLLSEGIIKVLTIQTEFVADLVADPYESIVQTGTEVFAVIKEMCTTAFYQPLSYRKTHANIDVNQKFDIGTVVIQRMKKMHPVH